MKATTTVAGNAGTAVTPLTVKVNTPATCDVAGCVGEGIDTATGAFTATVQDLLFPSGLFGMELTRSYRSDRTAAGWFGSGWSTVYETTLRTDATTVTIDAPAGLAPRWRPEAPQGWAVVGGVNISPASEGGHDLAWPTGERWTFDLTGRLTAMVSPYGQAITVEWVGDMPSTIRSSQGQAIHLTSSGRHITSATDDAGRKLSFGYEGDSLASTEAPGLAQQYQYNADGRIVVLQGPSGSTNVTYASGKVSAQTTASGQTIGVEYANANAKVTTGFTRVYEHDSEGRLTKVTQGGNELMVREFDTEGHLVMSRQIAQPGNRVVSEILREYEGSSLSKETSNGLVTTFTYDQQGRATAITTPDGTTTFEYEGQLPLPSTAESPSSGREEFSYESGFITASADATGVRTSLGRDSFGNPITRAVGDQSEWSYSFDAEGNVLTTKAPSGRLWSSEWAPRATLLTETDPAGRRSTNTYDRSGRVVRHTDKGGQTTLYTYDSNGRLSSETAPDGLVTKYEHSSDESSANTTLPGDRVWRSITEQLDTGGSRVTVTAPDGTMTVATVDSMNREIERRVLEADGSVVEERNFEFEFDRPTATLIERGNSRFETRTTHDEAGHMVAVIESLDGREVGATTYSYKAGRVTEAANEEQKAAYRYDAAGRLIEVVSGDDTWSAEYTVGLLTATRHNDQTTTIGYDIDARATSFTDPTGITTNWELDPVDRPLARSIGNARSAFDWSSSDQLLDYQAADGSKWSWRYDETGRLAKAFEPSGLVTTYEYELGAVTRISTEGGNGRDDKFTYDARGLLRTATTASGSFTYAYDATGSPTTIEGGGSEQWSYDAQGNVTGVTVGDEAFRLRYDEAGKLQGVVGPKGSLDTTWGNDGLTAVTADGRDPIRLLTDTDGRLSTIRWNQKTAVDLAWSKDSTFLQLTERGSDRTQEYTSRDGQLASFRSGDLQINAAHQQNGYLASLDLNNKGKAGSVRFDEVGRPVTVTSEGVTSTLSYDLEGRITSVLTSRPDSDPKQTTISYTGTTRTVDGDRQLVDALFTDDGAQRSPLPSTLASPVSASTGDSDASLLDPAAAGGALRAPEPQPLSTAAAAVQGATPTLTAPIGVKDLPHLAEQLAVAEITRLAPTVRANGTSEIRLPIIDPKSGRLADFNPFVDAAPSGLALGAIGRQTGDNSLFERATRALGRIAGKAVELATDIDEFLRNNKVARAILLAAQLVVQILPRICAHPACIAVLIAAAAIQWAYGIVAIVAATLDTIRSCARSAIAKCATGVALLTLIAVSARMQRGRNQELSFTKRVLRELRGGAATQNDRSLPYSTVLKTLQLERIAARATESCNRQACRRLDSVAKDLLVNPLFAEIGQSKGAASTESRQVAIPTRRNTDGALFPDGLAGNPEQTIVSQLTIQPWSGL